MNPKQRFSYKNGEREGRDPKPIEPTLSFYEVQNSGVFTGVATERVVRNRKRNDLHPKKHPR